MPYLYTASPTLEDPILTPLFEACSQGSAVMRAGADSPLGALCAEELAVLVRRIFDSWEPHSRNSRFLDSFAHTVGDLGEALKGCSRGRPYLRRGRVVSIAPSDTVRTRYGWFQRYDVLRDLSTIHARWEQTLAGKRHPLRTAIDRMRGRTLPIKCLETALAWVLFEGPGAGVFAVCSA